MEQEVLLKETYLPALIDFLTSREVQDFQGPSGFQKEVGKASPSLPGAQSATYFSTSCFLESERKS